MFGIRRMNIRVMSRDACLVIPVMEETAERERSADLSKRAAPAVFSSVGRTFGDLLVVVVAGAE
jgi:hypothetical protein